MAQILPHVLNSRAANGLHGDRVFEDMRVGLVLRDAGRLRVLLDQPPKLLPTDRKQRFAGV